MHRLLKGLQSLGHQIRVIAHNAQISEHDGIDIYPHGGGETLFTTNNDHCEWADVIFTQLIGSPHGYNKAKQHGKPLIFFAHNMSKHYCVNDALVVYNSNYTAGLKLFPNESTILQPLTPIGEQSHGKKIALINCNMNKGGQQFVELSRRLRQYDFIGYMGGYGEQITGGYVDYRQNGEIDWSEIGLLLVPSEFESWSQVATEAICHGIPVIANDLPALRENLSYAGIYIDRSDLDAWVKTIDYLMWDKSKQVELCLKRAKELDPEPRLLKFNYWLCNMIK